MTSETELLLRYLDDELSVEEAELFRARLSESRELRARLAELRRVGALVRLWASDVEARAGDLVEPTMRRVEQVEKQRARGTGLAFALAAGLVVALPWASAAHVQPVSVAAEAPSPAPSIERLEAGDKQAQVFVVGGGSTPVVWLADEVGEDEAALSEQDPG